MLCEVGLDALQVQQLGAEFEGHGQLLVELLIVLLELLGMLSLQLAEGLSVLLLGLEEIVVPLLVELVVLFDVSLLALLLLLSLVEQQLVFLSLVILVLEFGDPVLGHLSLDVLSFDLAGVSVLFEDFTIDSNAMVSGSGEVLT